MMVQYALLKCYTILYHRNSSVNIRFLQTNITVQMRPSGGQGEKCYTIYILMLAISILKHISVRDRKLNRSGETSCRSTSTVAGAIIISQSFIPPAILHSSHVHLRSTASKNFLNCRLPISSKKSVISGRSLSPSFGKTVTILAEI